MSSQHTSGEYRPFLWQIVKDSKGFESIYETNEDGRPGDLVADVYGDHASLVNAAPDLLNALLKLLVIAGTPINLRQEGIFVEVRAAIAKAKGQTA